MSDVKDKKNDLGAVSATEGDDVPCLVPTSQLSHAAPFSGFTYGELLDRLDEVAEWIDANGSSKHQTPWLIHRDVIREVARRLQILSTCPGCVSGLQPSTHVDEEQPMRLCSTCDGSGEIGSATVETAKPADPTHRSAAP